MDTEYQPAQEVRAHGDQRRPCRFALLAPGILDRRLMTQNSKDLSIRVVRAAEAALADHSYVSAIDVLLGMGLLAQSNLQAWRKGQVPFLEQVMQGNLHKISSSMKMFHGWAREKGLTPSETQYVRRTRSGTVELIFSKSRDPEIEKAYRTHFLSPALSETRRKRLQEKLDKPPQPVVFQILRDSRCTECGVEIGPNGFLSMEANQPLCLPCAGLGDLEFLPSGDTALTRRATRHSGRLAVSSGASGGTVFVITLPTARETRDVGV